MTGATTSAARSSRTSCSFWWNQEWNREVRGHSGKLLAFRRLPKRRATSPADAAAIAAGGESHLRRVRYRSSLRRLQAAGQSQRRSRTPILLAACWLSSIQIPNVAGATGTQNNWALQEVQRPQWSEWNVRADYDVTKKNRADLPLDQ